LFIHLGTDVLMWCLDDMVLDKMREYTNVGNNVPYSQQIDVFARSYSLVLSTADVEHLSHSSIRRNVNDIAYFSRREPGTKRYMSRLKDHLAGTNDEHQRQMCSRLFEFVYGEDGIRWLS
jgi:hypothetical protein